ncbi:MAG TPA: hypothetical protein G4O02_18455 [Caldilineae bacterium]|nr:hypothetical protein [Caldilineae bacterium]
MGSSETGGIIWMGEEMRRDARRRRTRKGLVIVNTGNGKGKTTAALGIVLRAWGRDFRVCVMQFLKNEHARWGAGAWLSTFRSRCTTGRLRGEQSRWPLSWAGGGSSHRADDRPALLWLAASAGRPANPRAASGFSANSRARTLGGLHQRRRGSRSRASGRERDARCRPARAGDRLWS